MNDEPFFYTAGVDVPEDATHLVIGGVTVVEAGTFKGHRNLVRVELQQGVLSIGAEAFSECRRLRRVDPPSSLRTIGDAAFFGCSSLPEMNFPEGLRSVGWGAFLGHRFERIAVPSSVMEIGGLAFAHGENLSKVTLVGGTVLVARSAFYECPRLRNIATPLEVIVVEDGENGNGRAAAATGGTIALRRLGREPNRLILTSPYLASMRSEDVARVADAINRTMDAGQVRSRLLGLLSWIDRIAGGRPRGEGPLDLATENFENWMRARRSAHQIRSRFLGLLSAHRGAIASVLGRALVRESGGGVEPGVVGIVLSFLGDVEGR